MATPEYPEWFIADRSAVAGALLDSVLKWLSSYRAANVAVDDDYLVRMIEGKGLKCDKPDYLNDADFHALLKTIARLSAPT